EVDQHGLAIRPEANLALAESFGIAGDGQERVIAIPVGRPYRQRTLAHVHVAGPVAEACAFVLTVQANAYVLAKLHGIDRGSVPQQDPDLDHVAGLAVL